MKSDCQLRTAVLAVSDSLTTVLVKFPNKTKDDWEVTFICTKALAKTLSAGKFAVADTRHGYRVCTVVEVHTESNFHDDEIEWRWVVRRVDADAVQRLEDKVQRSVASLKESQRRRMREQMVEALGFTDVGALAITTDDDAVIVYEVPAGGGN